MLTHNLILIVIEFSKWLLFQHTVETIGLPPRPVNDIDFRKVKFGVIPPYLCAEFAMFEKVSFVLKYKINTIKMQKITFFFKPPKPEDFGIYPETEPGEIPMIRWHGGETTALQLFTNRLQVEKETFQQ